MEASVFPSGRVRLAPAVIFAFLGAAAFGAAAPEKPRILASLFPQYDFARAIAGDAADVRMLLPPGAESHSYEPTPSDMKAVSAADLFIHTGEHMEPWAKRLAEAASRPGGVRVVDASRGIALRRDGPGGEPPGHDHEPGGEHDEHGDHGEHDHEPSGAGHLHEFDPHIWLDPTLAAAMIDTIAQAVIDADPDRAATYRKNAADLRERVEALDRDFRRTVEASPRRELVFGERFAFAYFFSRYGLEEAGPYRNCAPGAEPGLRAVIDTVKHIKANAVKHIYLEEMSQGRISRVLRQETGADILTVDSMHTVSAEKMAAGATYLDIMRANMDAFAKGLR